MNHKLLQTNQLILNFTFEKVDYESSQMDRYSCFIPKQKLIEYYPYQLQIEAHNIKNDSYIETMTQFTIKDILAIFFPDIYLSCDNQDTDFYICSTLQDTQPKFYAKNIDYVYSKERSHYFLKTFILKKFNCIVLNNDTFSSLLNYIILSSSSEMNEELIKLSARYALLDLSKKWEKCRT